MSYLRATHSNSHLLLDHVSNARITPAKAKEGTHVIAVWFTGVFIKFSLYMFITSYGTAQWLNIKKWRRTLWFITPIVIVLALLPRNLYEASVLYPQKFWLPYVFPVNMISIPLFLWLIGKIWKKKEKG